MTNYIDYNSSIRKQTQDNHLLNRSNLFGDGIFETMALFNGKIPLFKYHHDRLRNAARRTSMILGNNCSYRSLYQRVIDLSNKENGRNFRVKVMIFRDGQGKYQPEKNHTSSCITTEPLEEAKFVAGKGVAVGLIPGDSGIQHPGLALKTTSSIAFVMGMILGGKRGFKEMIFTNLNGHIIEACSSNLFFWFDNNLVITPSLETGCLEGVMRGRLIEILREEGVNVQEAKLSLEDIRMSSSLWLTNSIQGINWAREFEKKPMIEGAVKKYTDLLNMKFSL